MIKNRLFLAIAFCLAGSFAQATTETTTNRTEAQPIAVHNVEAAKTLRTVAFITAIVPTPLPYILMIASRCCDAPEDSAYRCNKDGIFSNIAKIFGINVLSSLVACSLLSICYNRHRTYNYYY